MENWTSSGDGASIAATEAAETPATAVATTDTTPQASRNDRVAEPDDARNFILYFGFDKATLDDVNKATLREAAAFAATLAEPEIIVAAYTDTAGDAEYNYLLAERRADAVLDGLDALGVRYGRIDMSLFGERSPWAVTLDGVNEASNRRVELFIEEPVQLLRLLALPIGHTDVDAASAQRPTNETQDGNEIVPASNQPPAGGPKERILPSIPPKTLM